MKVIVEGLERVCINKYEDRVCLTLVFRDKSAVVIWFYGFDGYDELLEKVSRICHMVKMAYQKQAQYMCEEI